MQDGCKSLHGFLHAIEWIMFHGHLDYLKNHLSEVDLTQNRVTMVLRTWSRTLKCSVKPYVTISSTKCYFNESLFIRVLTHDRIE
jgi:hypothetical protein